MFGALAYVGFASGLSAGWNVGVGPLSLQLLVAIALAWFGWRQMSSWAALRKYMPYAFALSFWIFVSSVAAWDTAALYWSVTVAVWLLFIVPGIASLIRNQRNRLAFFLGVAGSALMFAFTSLGRMATGREIFDLPDPSRALLMGLKRGLVNSRLLYVIPFFLAKAPRLGRIPWWLPAGALTGSILVSGGRSALLGLSVLVLTYVLLRPGLSQKLQGFIGAALLGLLLVMALAEFGGQAAVGKTRLVSYFRGERTTSDEVREAQLERAWDVGLRHPAFGVGYDHLRGIDHPAFDEVRSPTSRRTAEEGGVHNTYAQVFAEFGIPGALAFVILLLSLIRAGAASRHRPEIRAATTGLVGVMVMMLFHPLALSFVYLPIAYIVGALGDESGGRTSPRPRAMAGEPSTPVGAS